MRFFEGNKVKIGSKISGRNNKNLEMGFERRMGVVAEIWRR